MALKRHFVKVTKSFDAWVVYEVAECDEGRFVVSRGWWFDTGDNARRFALNLAQQVTARYYAGSHYPHPN